MAPHGNTGRKRPDLAARNKAAAKHGMYRSPTYNTWAQMRQRCEDSGCRDFARYGARGITVCERWQDFESFLADMGERPDGMTLDRINVNGNYEPGNCRWATPKQQQRNRRSNVRITHDGLTLCVAEWAERVELERKTLEYRVRAGWPAARALFTPSTTNRKRQHGHQAHIHA
jgi:hypothetical protein